MADKIELNVLRFIEENGPSTMLDMAASLNIATAEMKDILREGVRSGFLGRDYDKESKSIIYMLARRGRDAIEEHDLAQQIKQRDPNYLLERISELETQLAMANSALHASMQLNEELINDSGKAESAGQYIVFVDGGLPPMHVHDDEESARTEALRISSINNSLAKTIRVVKLVDTLNVSVNTVKSAEWSSGIKQGEAPANSPEQCGHCKEQCRA